MDEAKFNDPTPQRPNGGRLIDAGLVPIDLNHFIATIKTEKAWHESDRNAITVFKTDGLTLVLIAMHPEAEMANNITEGFMSIQVLEGALKLVSENEFKFEKGQMAVLHPNVKYSLTAFDEVIFLLTHTYAKGSEEKEVKHMAETLEMEQIIAPVESKLGYN